MGFRKKVNTRDQIFNIRIIMEKAWKRPLYMAFIDYKKTFDLLRKMGVSSPTKDLIQQAAGGQPHGVVHHQEGSMTRLPGVARVLHSEEVMQQTSSAGSELPPASGDQQPDQHHKSHYSLCSMRSESPGRTRDQHQQDQGDGSHQGARAA